MTQNEIVWALLSVIQLGILSFIGYWTRRVQKLEDTIAFIDRDLQGRVSRLEAQFAEIIKYLAKIDNKLDHHIERDLNDKEEDP